MSALIAAGLFTFMAGCSKAEVQTDKNSLVVAITEEPPAGFTPATKWPWSGDPIFQNMLYKLFIQIFEVTPAVLWEYIFWRLGRNNKIFFVVPGIVHPFWIFNYVKVLSG